MSYKSRSVTSSEQGGIENLSFQGSGRAGLSGHGNGWSIGMSSVGSGKGKGGCSGVGFDGSGKGHVGVGRRRGVRRGKGTTF